MAIQRVQKASLSKPDSAPLSEAGDIDNAPKYDATDIPAPTSVVTKSVENLWAYKQLPSKTLAAAADLTPSLITSAHPSA